MKELGDAINGSLSDSEQIAEVVARIKEGGYDIFLVLEATIGVSKQGERGADKTSLVFPIFPEAIGKTLQTMAPGLLRYDFPRASESQVTF